VFCIDTKRVQPWLSATCCAFANCQACMDDAPRYRVLPMRTTSCSASIVSSIGVAPSQRCIW